MKLYVNRIYEGAIWLPVIHNQLRKIIEAEERALLPDYRVLLQADPSLQLHQAVEPWKAGIVESLVDLCPCQEGHQ